MVHEPMGFVQKFLLLVTYFFEMRPVLTYLLWYDRHFGEVL